MKYTIAEIKQLIREVVREAKKKSRIDTGFLKRSISGDYNKRRDVVEFREIFYGVYNDNSRLIQIAQRIMPKDIDWKVIFEDEKGIITSVKAKTRTGRTIRRSVITNENVSTVKIKALISILQKGGKKKDDKTEGA